MNTDPTVTGEQPAAHSALDHADSPAVEHEQAQTAPADDAGAEGEGGDKPKPRPIQKRIGELVREREAARREVEYWRQQAAMSQQQQAQPAAAPPPAELKPEDFPTYEDYLVAKAETKAAQRLHSELAQRAQMAQQQAVQRERAAVVAQFQTRAEEARGRYEDFDLVVADPSTPISQHMAEAIMQSQVGHEVAYYLGRNKQEAARIAQLPPLAQAMEIARLEQRVAVTRRVSSAPPPPPTLGGSGTPARDPASARTYDEYVALRRKQAVKR
jgi:hypothetical protein